MSKRDLVNRNVIRHIDRIAVQEEVGNEWIIAGENSIYRNNPAGRLMAWKRYENLVRANFKAGGTRKYRVVHEKHYIERMLWGKNRPTFMGGTDIVPS